MKRKQLIRFLKDHNCIQIREGSRHSIWKNPKTGGMTSIPRHNEIKDILVKKILKDLHL